MSDPRPAAGEGLTRRQLFELVLPRQVLASSGRLELDRTKCSACALCARECPTGALEKTGPAAEVGAPAPSDMVGVTLLFRESLCDACGRCIEICPEQCLALGRATPAPSLEPGAGTAAAAAAASVLFQDEVAACPSCGAVIGSKAMITRVHAKIRLKDPVLAARLQLCPACRGKGS